MKRKAARLMGSKSAKPLGVTVMTLACLALVFGRSGTALARSSQKPLPHYLHAVWTTEQGLPQNSITAIVQTRDGYLWLATFGGLVRFDGVRFKVFQAGNNRILSLYEDRAGDLWIGTEGGGLVRYDDGVFTTITTREGLPSDHVWAISEDAQGHFWVGTKNGLARRDAGQWVTYTSRDGLPHNWVRCLLEDRAGTLWIGTRDGLVQWRHGTFHRLPAQAGAPTGIIDFLLQDRHGALWVAAGGKLARRIDGQFRHILLAGTSPTNWVGRLLEDRHGILWIGGSRGFQRWPDDSLIALTRSDGAPLEKLRALFEDREGNIWVGTNGDGLHRFRPGILTTYTPEDGLPGDSVTSIMEDRDGHIWIGAWAGLVKYTSERFTVYTRSDGLANNAIFALHQDRHGRLWIGTSGGLSRYEGGTSTSYTTRDGLPGHHVQALMEDRTGALWIGTDRGLGRFQHDQFTIYRTADGLVHNDVRFITEDGQGALWIGTMGGLSRFKDGTFTSYTTENGLSNNYVRAVYEDTDGTFWIGTYGGGLTRFKDGAFFHFTTDNGLFDNVVSRLLEDDQGRFWMSGNRGLFWVRRRELNDFAEGRIPSYTCISYGVADGMTSSECNGGSQPAGWKTNDGRLWFPTIKGIVVIDPRSLNPLPPPVVIEQMLIDGRPVELREHIEVPPSQGNLEFHYTGLSVVAADKVQFRYQLEGYDRDWVEARTRRAAYYTHLPPGHYRFRVRACNNDGVWNEMGTTVEFSLKPHFYQTMWFYALSLAALMVMGWGGYRWRVKHLERRNRELAAKVAERTAEVEQQKNQLAHANQQLARANDDMVSIFNRWRSGVMTTNEAGQVTFLSRTAEHLFGLSPTDVLGQSWERILPLTESDQTHLDAMAKRPPEQRSKLSVYVHGPDGQRYWMEIEVEDDPRDPRRKMFFLYDVSEVYDLRRLLDEKAKFHDLVGESALMQLVYRQVQDLARSDTSVLIEGETGTGKELVARAIHYGSPRKVKPFIAVNCGGLTESLLGSQLFGHKKGAFTGATADQAGYFEAASGGTVFLDEIGDMPPSMQTSVLRVLQEKEVTRLGETSPRKVDVRVIAATNRDLAQAVAEGRFRQDLLYRIRGTRVHVPSLRDRREDIPLLAAWFLGQLRITLDTPAQEISQNAMQALVRYDWPGNVRELKSAVESAAIQCRGPVIQVEDWPPEILGFPLSPLSAAELRSTSTATNKSRTPGRPARSDLRRHKKRRVQDALERAGDNRATAAQLLGISRSTLYLWMKELGLKDSTDEPGK